MLGIYCRISRDKEEGKDRSINDQKHLGMELAKKLDLPYKLFIDEGVSGTLPIKDRPRFSDLLDEIEDNKITHLYSYDQSRLERSPQTRFLLNKILKENSIRLFTESGEVDIFNDEDEMLGDIKSIFNSYSVRQTIKKVKSVLRRRVKDGKAHSSILPYGYAKDENSNLVIDDEEAKTIVRIFDLSLFGNGTNKIAELFNNEGILTRYSKIGKGTLTVKNKYTKRVTVKNKKDIKWSGNTIRNIIKNTIYMGKRKYEGEFYNSPFIIDPILWQKVNENLEKNRNNSGKNVEHKYLLKGLLRCAKCGRNYYGRTRISKKDNYYMCSSKRKNELNCGNRSINIDVLESFIWDRFFENSFLFEKLKKYYSNPENKDIIIKKQVVLTQFQGELKKLEESKKRAVKYAIDGILRKEDIRPQMERIEKEIVDIQIKKQNLEQELNSLKESKRKIQEVEVDLWDLNNDTPFNIKKELINKYITDILIYYKDNIYTIGISYKSPVEVLEILQIEKNYIVGFDPFSKSCFFITHKFEDVSKIENAKKLFYNQFEGIHVITKLMSEDGK